MSREATERLYPPRNPCALGQHYMRHIDAMTREGLHYKADIAEQLAWRDQEIERLKLAEDQTPRLLAAWHRSVNGGTVQCIADDVKTVVHLTADKRGASGKAGPCDMHGAARAALADWESQWGAT